jgi:Lon protease-like protein
MTKEESTCDYAPGSVIEELPLFPLPKVVFFPGALLPLHVFEPRYRVMTERALETNRQLSVVLITDNEVDENGHPQIASIAGVGEIVHHVPMTDGRHQIVLLGRARVELEELPFEPPYRRARARVLGSDSTVPENDIAALVSITTRFVAQMPGDKRAELELPTPQESGELADAIADALVIDPSERQRILEAVDLTERVRLTSEAIAVQQALFSMGTSSTLN